MKFKKIGKNLYKNDKGVFKGFVVNKKLYGKFTSNNMDNEEYYFGSIINSKYYTGRLKKKDMTAPVLNYLLCDFEGDCLKGKIFNGKAIYYDDEFSIIIEGRIVYNSFD